MGVNALFKCATCDGTGTISGYGGAGIAGRYGSAGPLLTETCGRCYGCGYDLADGYCPMCGETLDPATMTLGEAAEAMHRLMGDAVKHECEAP